MCPMDLLGMTKSLHSLDRTNSMLAFLGLDSQRLTPHSLDNGSESSWLVAVLLKRSMTGIDARP